MNILKTRQQMKTIPKSKQPPKAGKLKNRSGDKNVPGKNRKDAASRGKMITLRGIDPALSQKIKSEAEKESKSINQFLVDTLRKSLGVEKKKMFTRVFHDLDGLFGQWSDKEFRQIQNQIEAQRTIDAELWQ